MRWQDTFVGLSAVLFWALLGLLLLATPSMLSGEELTSEQLWSELEQNSIEQQRELSQLREDNRQLFRSLEQREQLLQTQSEELRALRLSQSSLRASLAVTAQRLEESQKALRESISSQRETSKSFDSLEVAIQKEVVAKRIWQIVAAAAAAWATYEAVTD